LFLESWYNVLKYKFKLQVKNFEGRGRGRRRGRRRGNSANNNVWNKKFLKLYQDIMRTFS
jgi:hypothetical protein